MSRFNQELQTISIGDYIPVDKGETRHPFNEDLYPQGSVAPKFNRENRKPKFKYIESANHGRSIDEIVSSGKVLWGGKFKCDKFGARDLKGARHEAPAIKKTKGADGHTEIRAVGMYDETDVSYLIKASEYLRSQGIVTENIGNIYQINEIIFDGKRMPIKEWALHNIVAYIAKQKMEGNHNPDEIKELTDFAYDTKFFQVERELQVSERIRDLAVCKTKEEFIEIIETPLKWLNAVAKTTNEGVLPGTDRPEFFDLESYKDPSVAAEHKQKSKEDIQLYLENWLPSQMGIYLGRCRKAGVGNDFGHAQQWSLVATEYDGQSFVGKEIDGQELKESDYAESLSEALGVLEELFNPPEGNFIRQEFNENGEALENAKVILLTNYFREIGMPDIDEPNAYVYTKLIDNTFFDGQKNILRSLKPETYIKAMYNVGVEFEDNEVEIIKNIHNKFEDLSKNRID